MDLKDFQSGKTDNIFYFKAKNKLIKTIIQKACKKQILNNKKLKILNVGVGTGNDLKILNKFGENYVVDINKQALDIIDKRLYKEKKIEDACNLSYSKNYFDVVVAFGIMEHVKNDKNLFQEAFRVLKPGGTIIFSGPSYQFLFSSHDIALEHYRRYNTKRIKWLMKDFKKLKLFYWNFFLFPGIALMRILKKNFKAQIDDMKLPIILNNFLYQILKLEIAFIKNNVHFPWGVGFIGHSQKPFK